jgi:Kef-type K+ transport system membrane component KefB
MPQNHRAPAGPLVRASSYLGLLLLGVGGFLFVRHLGRDLLAPPPATGSPLFMEAGGKKHVDVLMHVLLALSVVIITARAIGALFSRLRQPAVIGEVLAGILLGPSLLGRVAPEVSAFLLPTTVAPSLQIISQVGVIIYMFIVGLELDLGLVRTRTHATVAISHASIVLPFLMGSGLALLLYPRVSSSDVPFTPFALFCGVSMSVTAFPVLARILTDRRQHRSRLGVIALTCAAVDDVTAWCLLAFVVSVVHTRMGGALLTAGLSAAYIAGMLFVARPLLARLVATQEQKASLTQSTMAVIFVGLLLSALATDAIGIHAVFGAFVLGAVIPHDSRVARELTARLEDVVVVLLLPAFFAYTGMRTQIGLVSSAEQWLLCGLVVVVASAGKFGGSFVAARLTGLGWRDAASIGVLMNTRGLMELIVLNIGLDLRVISPTLFAMLVIMALVTTFATTPVLHTLSPPSPATAPQPRDLLSLEG